MDKYAPGATDLGTAGIPLSQRVRELEEALLTVYDTDAHIATYLLTDPKGKHKGMQWRLKKVALPWLRSRGWDVRHQCQFADVDRPGHQFLDSFSENEAHRRLDMHHNIAWYPTRAGLRVFRTLESEISPETYEHEGLRWLGELQLILGPSWIVDHQCRDWTRLFRLPNVRRQDDNCAPVDLRAPVIGITKLFPVTLIPYKPPPPLVPKLRTRSEKAKKAYVAAVIRHGCDRVRCAAQGKRNQTLYITARTFAHRDMELSDSEIISHLTPAAWAAGLTSQETHATLRSGIETGRKDTNSLREEHSYPERLPTRQHAPAAYDGACATDYDSPELTPAELGALQNRDIGDSY